MQKKLFIGLLVGTALASVAFAKAPKGFEESAVVEDVPYVATRPATAKKSPASINTAPAPVNPAATAGTMPTVPEETNARSAYGKSARSRAAAGQNLSDDDGVTSEQPRATASLQTVGRNRFQVETRFDYQRETNTATGQNQYAFPTQFRYGFVDPFEVHVKGNMFTIQQSTASTNRGFGDLAVGAKWAIAQGAGLVPSLGVVADVGIPTGSNNVSQNAVVPAGSAILHWKLPAEFLLDSNVGLDLPPGDGINPRATRFTYGLAARRALPALDNRLGAFVEMAGGIPFKSTGTTIHQAGTGLSFRLSDHFDTSTFARVGLSDAAPNFQTGLGISWKP